MCGLAGFLTTYSFKENPENFLVKMANAISHRGPDDSGFWYSKSDGIYLAHRRLSILDISSAGHQPMTSKSSRFTVVFNGEIYNHLDLRKKLSNKLWRSHSDTETLLECFEEWGIKKTFVAISGMFAIALWDKKFKKLILARDKFGEKPLYYGGNSTFLFFASELKALKEFPLWKPQENPSSVNLLLRYAYIPSPLTIYQDVYKLAAGSYLEISLDNLSNVNSVNWWDYKKIALNKNLKQINSDEEAIANFQTILSASVNKQMLSDVPIGALLSGGIDSSLIVAMMQLKTKVPVNTFTVGFNEAKYDESNYAKAIASHLGTNHSEIYISSKDAINIIPKLGDIYDEPFADSSQIPSFLISQFASQQVKVCLTGDGADELFGGYNRYAIAPSLWKLVSQIPVPLRIKIAKILKLLPIHLIESIFSPSNKLLPSKFHVHNFGEKIIKVANSFNAENFDEFYSSYLSQWHGSLPLINQSEPKVFLNDHNRWPNTKNLTKRMMIVDAMSYLTDDILVKTDRASMSVGLELRAPYLNEDIVNFAVRLSEKQKIRTGQSKWLLKQLLYKYVPQHLLNRPKQGFGVPIEYWLRGPLRDWAEDLLSYKKLASSGFFPLSLLERCGEAI